MYTTFFWDGRSETSIGGPENKNQNSVWLLVSYFVGEPKKMKNNSQNETVYKSNLNFWPNFWIIIDSIK